MCRVQRIWNNFPTPELPNVTAHAFFGGGEGIATVRHCGLLAPILANLLFRLKVKLYK